MILNHILEIYMIYYVSVTLHELAHFWVAKAIGLNVKKIQIGDDLFSIKIGKCSLSINCMYGSGVMFENREMIKKNRLQMSSFFLAGAVVNLIIMLSGHFLKDSGGFYADVIFWENLYLLAGSLIPFMAKGNDMNKLMKYWRG